MMPSQIAQIDMTLWQLSVISLSEQLLQNRFIKENQGQN